MGCGRGCGLCPSPTGSSGQGVDGEESKSPHDLGAAGTENGSGKERLEVGGLGNSGWRGFQQLGQYETPSVMQDDLYLMFPGVRISP